MLRITGTPAAPGELPIESQFDQIYRGLVRSFDDHKQELARRAVFYWARSWVENVQANPEAIASEFRRSYWRHYYKLNSKRILRAQRERYQWRRQRQAPPP